MWYPFKFWRNVGYVHVTGRLAELSGRSGNKPKRQTLRAVARAERADSGYLVAVPRGSWQFAAIEVWATLPDHSFRSLTARFVDSDGHDLWVQTATGRRGAFEMLAPWPDRRSPFDGFTTTLEGRTVDVAYVADAEAEPPVLDRVRPLAELLSG